MQLTQQTNKQRTIKQTNKQTMQLKFPENVTIYFWQKITLQMYTFGCTVNRICQCFVWKKLISQPWWGVQKSPFLEEMIFIHYILMSVICWSHLATCLHLPRQLHVGDAATVYMKDCTHLPYKYMQTPFLKRKKS